MPHLVVGGERGVLEYVGTVSENHRRDVCFSSSRRPVCLVSFVVVRLQLVHSGQYLRGPPNVWMTKHVLQLVTFCAEEERRRRRRRRRRSISRRREDEKERFQDAGRQRDLLPAILVRTILFLGPRFSLPAADGASSGHSGRFGHEFLGEPAEAASAVGRREYKLIDGRIRLQVSWRRPQCLRALCEQLELPQ